MLNIAPDKVLWVWASCFNSLKLYEPLVFELFTVSFTVFTPLDAVSTFTLPLSTNPSFTFELTLLATYLPFCNVLVIVNVIGVLFST